MTDAEKSPETTDATTTSTPSSPGAGRKAGIAARGALGLIASVVRFVTSLFAAILLVEMILLLFGNTPFKCIGEMSGDRQVGHVPERREEGFAPSAVPAR